MEAMDMEYISTRQVAARIRAHKLPDYSRYGEPRCACHPEWRTDATTEALKFWSKGDKIVCPVTGEWAPALVRFDHLGIIIDTRL
jgi:hypothetical protein